MRHGALGERVETKLGRTWLEILSCDIASPDVDAIVAATDVDFSLEAVPAGATERGGGKVVKEDAGAHGPATIGDAVPMAGSGPKARWVILAAVRGQDLASNAASVAAATTRSLEVAETLGARSVAFPPLGAEGGGLPLYACTDVILANVRAYLIEHPRSRIGRVVFCASDAAAKAAFSHAMAGLWRSEAGTDKRP